MVKSGPLRHDICSLLFLYLLFLLQFEMKSHFGNEHFCPLTLIRLLGLSMVEEYEENEDKQAEEKLDNKVNEPEQVSFFVFQLCYKNLLESFKKIITHLKL